MRERDGELLEEALAFLVVDGEDHWARGEAAGLLSLAKPGLAATLLLEQFFAQQEKTELWITALALETLSDKRAVPKLIQALLHDENPHRRHAAARALGWIREPGRGAARALISALTVLTQPQPVREEAAESLAYLRCAESIPALVETLRDPDGRIRFWTVFALGSRLRPWNSPPNPQALQALEAMLGDEYIPEGNWWSVGLEALAMLEPQPGYPEKFRTEVARIQGDPGAADSDRRWVRTYGDQGVDRNGEY